jgi:hypothetical protein
MFRWKRGDTRGGCIVIPCGCLVSLPFVFLGAAIASLFTFRAGLPPTRWALAVSPPLAGFGEKGS